MVLRTFGWSFAVTAAGLVGGYLYGGWAALGLVAILSILEISLSFDNAVINAKVLQRMSAFWQKIFLTIGVLIAVFGMRLVFPFLLVGITASLNPAEAIDLAINDKVAYRAAIEAAHPAIAGFGGMFLLMIFLDFIFEERELTWLGPIERALAKIGKLDQLSVLISLGALVLTAQTLANNPATVLISGILGLLTYLAVNGLAEFFETEGDEEDEHAAGIHGPAAVAGGKNNVKLAVGKAAFFLFLYLEVLDASFSFDGVVGAFAVTQDPFIIAIGLGVGAMYIRSLTVYLVRKGTLSEYVYLEHGAHWAIGALAVILLVTIKYPIPEIITGLIGVVLILAAVISSVLRNRRLGGDHGAEVIENAPVAGSSKA